MNCFRTKGNKCAQNTGNLVDIVLFSPMTTQIHSFSNAKVNRAHTPHGFEARLARYNWLFIKKISDVNKDAINHTSILQ